MKFKTLINFAIASLLSTSALANQQIANQYFYGYQDQFNNGGKWGLIDDVDFDTLIADSSRIEAKQQFVQNGRILFDVKWTGQSLKKMYPNDWEYARSLQDPSDKKQAFKDLRQMAEQECPAQMEIGYARTYGIPHDGFAAELDTDTKHCNFNGQNLGTIRMNTFIPTIPGAKYALSVKYQKREYDFERLGVKNAKQAYRPLIVRVAGEKHSLDLEPVEGETLENGFKKAWITFTADRYFTPVVLNGTGAADSFGILIRGLHVDEIEANANAETCDSYYPKYSGKHKRCLTGEIDPDNYGCDLANADINWNGAFIADYRSNTDNLSHSDDDSKFVSIGKGKRLIVKMKDQWGKAASCPIAGKTLTLKEVTWGNYTYANYAEKALVKVRLSCADENGDFSAKNELLTTIDGDDELKTNGIINYTFDSETYKGCSLINLQIQDRTNKIKAKEGKVPANSDGVDINSLSIKW